MPPTFQVRLEYVRDEENNLAALPTALFSKGPATDRAVERKVQGFGGDTGTPTDVEPSWLHAIE